MRIATSALIGLLVTLGCGPEATPAGDALDGSTGATTGGATSVVVDGDSSGAPVTGPSDGDPLDSTGDGTTGDNASDSRDSSSSADDTGSTGDPGCAMDVLFVVDNSGSMHNRVPRLVEAIPQFVESLEGVDLRAMVVDVDADPNEVCANSCESNPSCYEDGVCTATPECLLTCATCTDYDCAEPPQPDECNLVLGGGLTVEQGATDPTSCGFASRERWIDGTEPDFAEALACAANVGDASTASTERVMQSMVAALDTRGPASVCNAGFLRPEAGLTVVLLTDEDDGVDDSAGNAVFWQLELEASQTDDERIVVLAITADNDQPDSLCTDSEGDEPGEVAPRIQEFVESFGERGLMGSICAEDYAPSLLEAAAAIAATCD